MILVKLFQQVIKELVVDEVARSKEIHEEKFHSLHEAESIIREELEECEESLELCRLRFDKELHTAMRDNCNQRFSDAASYIGTYAIETALEAIQLAAMCSKSLEFLNEVEK